VHWSITPNFCNSSNDIAVLLKVYANCIDGQASAANGRISDAPDEDGRE
jgi:hypothetical protein